MAVMQYLKNNAKWMIKKQRFCHLLATPVSENQLFESLEKLLNTPTESLNGASLFQTQFALNEIAISRASNPLQKALKQEFFEYEKLFETAKQSLTKAYEPFPSFKDGTVRMQSICQLFVTSTQLRHNQNQLQNFKNFLAENSALNKNELDSFEDFLTLTLCQYFCATYFFCAKSNTDGEFFVANLLASSDILKSRFFENEFYSKTTFNTNSMLFAVDCFANSTALCENQPTGVFLTANVTQNSRNVFDTFTNHKYGKKTANFLALNGSTQVNMQYHVRNSSEFRRYSITSRAKGKKLFGINLNCGVQLEQKHSLNYFETQNAHCIGVSGKSSYYLAFAVVQDSKICPVAYSFDENGKAACLKLNFEHSLSQGQKLDFDVVTIFAHSIEELSNQLSMCNKFGFSACPAISDSLVEGQLFAIKTNVTSASNLLESKNSTLSAPILNYTYQFGDSNVATFLSNNGNSVTLLNGFAFGTEGEKLFAVNGNCIAEIANSNFTLTPEGFVQNQKSTNQMGESLHSSTSKAVVSISHSGAKSYTVTFENATRLLAMFCFEEQSHVSVSDNIFEVKSPSRHFKFVLENEIESFSTNAIECNSMRLRHKLSNDLNSGQCLAICFKKSQNVKFEIQNCTESKPSKPTVRESLLSTYLNYINDKNIFCLKNRLRPADALTVSALAYTNSDFLHQYILQLECSKNLGDFSTCYYDNSAKLINHKDKILYPLAVTYYVTLTGNLDFLTQKRREIVKEILLHQSHFGLDLCHKALALKRLSVLNFDKVNMLSEYCKIKRDIMSDKALYGYAQAIGAVEMINPSKLRLKDLCNTFNVPKSWYYVSQLENLYGVKINGNILSVKPTVSAENCLEQFVLNYNGKSINTKFEKSSVQSMLLNGVCYMNCISADLMKDGENEMVIRY